ncbi:hypothetical protein OUZ56_029532 [Daphnia magna]|uniref:Uncharacterized protein n=1 Tax=Daphnia magna TaxID=35525 RepID=A0ABR0B739_9CRUS|nr:hypothetical protein OUZ56_029532 [Daphnia magna]
MDSHLGLLGNMFNSSLLTIFTFNDSYWLKEFLIKLLRSTDGGRAYAAIKTSNPSNKEDAEPLLCTRIAPKDGKLLKRWNEFIPRKGTLKHSSKSSSDYGPRISRYALPGKIAKTMTNPGSQRPKRMPQNFLKF